MQASLERLRARREELDGEGGFTLIELLIVIVILGILAAIVVFAVQNLTGQSATASCQAQYKTVETAMESYKAQINSYPTQKQGFNQLTTQQTGIDGSTDGPWLRDLPPEGIVALDTSTAVSADSYQTTNAVTPPKSPYYLTIDLAASGTANYGAVEVGTLAANGASKTHASADGDAACADA